MPGFGLKNIFKKKTKEKEQTESYPADLERREDTSISYVQSPSALEYPGIRKEQAEEESKKDEKTVQQPETEKPEEKTLPRCPKCGWAIGYEDNVCSNCGNPLQINQ